MPLIITQVGYKFNFHPKNILEYKKILLNLKKLKKIKINKNEIFEFYFMRYMYQDRNWLFKNLDKMINDIGGGII